MCCDAVATDLAWTSQAMIGGAATPSVITALGTPSTRTQGWVAQAQEGLEQKQALRKVEREQGGALAVAITAPSPDKLTDLQHRRDT
eukprot:CAMPEP_0194783528 /NCGR_PEP_ID=MMETSP0323_2-20130528/79271_1 /TAXON_ID=2866 ORGANISM="Crypthecodinium cohnii, Strain Seligo" /NCGR_SAMPLE_ID=MMETSP0323_2 /ASSEMBLY_ACC=CAM_ASM_000346 /LENGTH=86 /DNA_ID=CAMNT_0039722419 /DNA_START=602 /DNA_END=863 /DNA_ORIENTATION=+